MNSEVEGKILNHVSDKEISLIYKDRRYKLLLEKGKFVNKTEFESEEGKIIVSFSLCS